MGDLSLAAYELCSEVREGLWAKPLERVPNGQPAACEEIIAELRSRVPGLTKEEYQRAISRGMLESLF